MSVNRIGYLIETVLVGVNAVALNRHFRGNTVVDRHVRCRIAVRGIKLSRHAYKGDRVFVFFLIREVNKSFLEFEYSLGFLVEIPARAVVCTKAVARGNLKTYQVYMAIGEVG